MISGKRYISLLMHTHPVVIMLGNDNGVDIFSSSAVPEDNSVLISGAEEVPVQVHGQVAGLPLQHQHWVINLKAVEKITLVAVAVDLATLGEVSEDNNEIPTTAGAKIRSISVQLLKFSIKFVLKLSITYTV